MTVMRRLSLKTAVLFFVIFFLTGTSMGQSKEQLTGGEYEVIFSSRNTTLYPWIFYTGSRVTIDARYNFDQIQTGTVCIGKKFGTDALTVIPEVCGYSGRNNGYGPELWLLSETKKFSMTSYFQYAKFLDTKSFGYAWMTAELKASKNFQFGIGAESLKEGSRGTISVGLGPSMKVIRGKMYFTLVPLWKVTPAGRGDRTVFLSVGFVF